MLHLGKFSDLISRDKSCNFTELERKREMNLNLIELLGHVILDYTFLSYTETNKETIKFLKLFAY